MRRSTPRLSKAIAAFAFFLLGLWLSLDQGQGFFVSSAQAAEDAALGLYGRRIVVVESLSLSREAAFAAAIGDLKRTLEKMTGAAFAIDHATRGAAIVFELTSSSLAPRDAVEALRNKGTEAFHIRGDANRLTIVANEPAGLAHAVYYYLEALGARWLLPNEKWTVIPTRRNIALTIDRLVEPAFEARGYFGTGGYFSVHWGHNYPGSATLEATTTNWQRRLRYGAQYRLSGAVGEGFISDPGITPILANHPEYLAKVHGGPTPLYLKSKDGRRQLNTGAKINAGNPEAVALFCDWALRNLDPAKAKNDPHAQLVFSVEPSDGNSYGDDSAELPGDGSPSDQTFYIANECAKKARARAAGAWVNLYAYAGHAASPSFPLERNVIVQLAPYAFSGMRPEQMFAMWRNKATKLALYDYWSIPDWSFDEPNFDVFGLQERMRRWRADRVEAVTAESSFGAGAMGLGLYVAAHLMWDPKLDARELADDWEEKAFGPAKVPMKRMLERWSRSFRLASYEIGLSYRDLTEATQLAQGNAAVEARLDDFAVYLHYLRLRLEASNQQDAGARAKIVTNLVAHLLSINDTAMAHTTRLFDLYARSNPALVTAFALASPKTLGPGWSAVRKLSHREIAALLSEGARAYPSVAWEAKTYTGPLTPLQPIRWRAPNGDPWGPNLMFVGDLTLDLEMPQGLDRLPLRVTKIADTQLIVSNAAGAELFRTTVEKVAEAGDEAWRKGLATTEELSIPLKPGNYKVKILPQGANRVFSLQSWKGVPLNLSEFKTPKPLPTPKLYFFVPRGLKKIVLYYPLGDFGGAFGFQVLDPAGKPAQIRYADERRIMEVDVPENQDGKIWALFRSVSPNDPHRMLNAPQSFALSPETLRVPADALAAGGLRAP